jgi:hypothetical protein
MGVYGMAQSAFSLPRSTTLLAGLSSTSRQPNKTRNLKVICVCCFKKHEIVMYMFEINP